MTARVTSITELPGEGTPPRTGSLLPSPGLPSLYWCWWGHSWWWVSEPPCPPRRWRGYSGSLIDWRYSSDRGRWVLVGILVMVIIMRIPYVWYRRAAVWVLGFSMLGLILVPMFGVTRGGAERWLQVGSVTVQPSEFSKLAVILFLAAVLTDRSERLGELQQVLGPVFLSVGVTCALVVMQPDASAPRSSSRAPEARWCWLRGVPMRYVFGGAALAVLLAAFSTLAYQYRRERFTCFLDPLAGPTW